MTRAALSLLLLLSGCLGNGASGGSLTGTLGDRTLSGVVLDTTRSRASALAEDCRMAPGGSMTLVFTQPTDGGTSDVVLSFALSYDRLRLNADENRDRALVPNPALAEPGWISGGDLRSRWRLSHPDGAPAFEGGRLTFERGLASHLLGTLTLNYADGGVLIGDFNLESELIDRVDCDESSDPFSALPIPGPH